MPDRWDSSKGKGSEQTQEQEQEQECSGTSGGSTFGRLDAVGQVAARRCTDGRQGHHQGQGNCQPSQLK